jgi:hypothetical protein
MASFTSLVPAWWNTPTGWRRRWGTINGAVFPVRTCLPPIHSGMSKLSPASLRYTALSWSRSGVPGA